jgi:hypothetical protein
MSISKKHSKPAGIPFLITMDTEGDNLWENCGDVSTENARYLPRFQGLCEAYGLVPSWLATHEMVTCPIFMEFARDCISRNVAEIGTHLHAWDSPPLYDLTGNDRKHKPYLTEYPRHILDRKLKELTELITETFDTIPSSHRAGRWSIDPSVVQLLCQYNYTVDCSVTPGVSWKHALGAPNGEGGTDYTRCPRMPYWMGADSLEVPGNTRLLQVPVSIVTTAISPVTAVRQIAAKTLSLVSPRYRHRRVAVKENHWLRPGRNNLASMKAILNRATQEHWPCVEFMLHSSELMPGGNPNFKDAGAIDQLYDNMESLFAHSDELGFRGMTLNYFQQHLTMESLNYDVA